ncbi:DAK2 domain-containing protein [Nocardioides sp. MAH-18]|uniref:DAK2 domain-containing protein n=1 Tax=Nocardioides agri TaxID=2682843 RepID=A0A6L6XRW2_9ACTN|nr:MULTISPECIES: DAK2 domain-containing protein [unclassified Nocardioides]MBA2953488.1 DAK2 domain-containing protein [Nocardioides sp. CGMCC 1.13656]MVQ48355.1 DAK2 domain-containing protein [Nocardioides sp. MAH-18]
METPRSGVITLEVVLRFVDLATDALAAAREEIDALNVYPVPDGDTGTNMYLTVTAGRDAIRAVAEADPDADVGVALGAFARGALLGARGNSGVILSEMLGAIARRVAEASPDERNAQVMTQAVRCAADASYAAVGTPVEGTMLTVIRAAAEAAEALDPSTTRARDVFVAAAAGAREALAHTPEQLPALAQAGVIDAGGRGVSVILDAAETVLTGRRPVPVTSPIGSRHIPVPQPDLAGDLTPDGPAYEVMYLLDAEDDAIGTLRAALGTLGDSLVVVGGDGIWNVHVHVDDVGAAIEAGIEAGRPHRVRVTHFAEQVAEAGPRMAPSRTGRRVVAVAAGPGLAALFEEAEAVVVLGGPGRRASAGELHEAIVGCGAAEVVVLPNDADTVRAAEIAARTAEADLAGAIRVAVIPTHAQVTGLAAVAVHEPGRNFDQDVLEMTATARHARQGAVTVAARQAMTMAGPCEPGDALGVIAGDFAVVGKDLYTVATEVLDRLLAGGGELVTIVAGEEDADGSLATRCAAYVEDQHPAVDVVVYDGGQPRYPLLMSAE